MLMVSSGNFSEGKNFSDDLCRGIILIGIPYLWAKDPRLELKQ